MEAFVTQLMDRLLATSLQTTLLAALVWSLCRFVPRLSPATQCWLWWLVALQAMVGLVVSPVQLPWLAPAALEPGATALLPTLDPIGGLAPMASASSGLGLPITWPTALFFLWMAGLMVAAALTLRSWLCARALVHSATPCTDESSVEALKRAAASCGLQRLPALRLSHDIDSPLLAGRARPALLLPMEASLTPVELDMALLHELMHLRRRDLWWGILPAMARRLFFFHPMVHLAVREYGMAREAACDAAVVAREGHSRRDYGQLLLRLGACADTPAGVAVASSTFRALSKRLVLLQQTACLSRTSSVALVGLVAIAGVLPLRLVAGAAQAMPVADQTRPESPEAAPPAGNPAPTPQTAQEFLLSRLAESERRLRESQERLRDFTPPQQRTAELEARLAQLQRDYEVMRAQYEALIARLGSPQQRRAAEELRRSREQLEEMKLRYTEKHPEMQELRRRMQELERELRQDASAGIAAEQA